MSTTTTELTSWINPEKVEARIRNPNLPPLVSVAIADVDSVGEGMGSVVSIIKMADMTIPAGTVAENAEFPVITSTDTDITIADGLVGVSFQLSSKASKDAIENTLVRKANLIQKKLALRVDQDGLDLILGSNNTQNYTGQNLTLQRLTTAQVTFAAQNPSVTGTPAFVATPRVVGDLKLDMQASGGAFLGSDAASAQVAQMLGQTLGSANGFQGMYQGLAIFQTTQAPTTGNDCNAAMVVSGPESAWAYRSWETLQMFTKWQQESASWLVTIYIRYGWGLADDEQQLEVVLDNVA